MLESWSLFHLIVATCPEMLTEYDVIVCEQNCQMRWEIIESRTRFKTEVVDPQGCFRYCKKYIGQVTGKG